MEPRVGTERGTSPLRRKSRRITKLSALAVAAALIACASCSTPNGGSPPASNPPPGSGQESSPPVATAPESTSTSQAAAFDHIKGSVTVTDPDQYTFDVAFDLQILISWARADIASAKPGQVNVAWGTSTNGNITITNTTLGHTLRMPLDLTNKCIYYDLSCPRLYGFYPPESPVCTVEVVGTNLRYADANGGTFHVFTPPGEWCAVAFAEAKFSEVDSETVLPVSGAVSTTWEGLAASSTLLHEADFSALASALAAKPQHWEIEATDPFGGREKSTPQTPPGCNNKFYVIWSSTPLVCSKRY
jgi:hypothetical protein